MCVCTLQLPVLELLVQYGADIDVKTRNGESPFGKRALSQARAGIICVIMTSLTDESVSDCRLILS